MASNSSEFAETFGAALGEFLAGKGITLTEAASRLGVTKQALSLYCSGSTNGKRRKPRPKANAEVLALACAELGFEFRYREYLITAASLGKVPRERRSAEQLSFSFSRQFELTDGSGHISVRVKRPPGRIELAVSVDAAS
jgi:transcriptional regulator with XRE-family HTH domain